MTQANSAALWAAVAGLVLAPLSAAVADAPAVLRPQVVTQGPALTLGDLFENAGAAADRAVAPAPQPGRTAVFSAGFIAAAAQAAGLDWRPAADHPAIQVFGGSAARGSAASAVSAPGMERAIRRGDVVTLTYQARGLHLSTRGRALEDARVGETVRVQNVQSNRPVDAIATGPGSAIVQPL